MREQGRKGGMDGGGGSFIDSVRTVGSQDRAQNKLEYWDLENSRDTHSKGG